MKEAIQFYPTPKNVCRIIDKHIDWGKVSTVLEPSGGEGDLLIGLLGSKFNTDNNHRLDDNIKKGCIFTLNKDIRKIYTMEIDPYFRGELSKIHFVGDRWSNHQTSVRVIGSDFLSYSSSFDFDLIAMNPPFQNGSEHLLKAWEILREGQIVCILNKETISNPFSKSRQVLKKLIKDNDGKVIDLGSPFKGTNVETVLVVLYKKGKPLIDIDFQNLSKLKTDGYAINTEGDKFLVSNDELDRRITTYHHKINQFKKVMEQVVVLRQYKGDFEYFDLIGGLDAHNKAPNYQLTLNNYIEELTADEWNRLIELPRIQKYFTTGVKKKFHEYVETNGYMEFNRENIVNFIDSLFHSFENIMEEALMEIFDRFTKHHKDNRVDKEGWWSNDAFKVNKKIVIPWIWRAYSQGSLDWDIISFLDDIDKVLMWLSGDRLEDVNEGGPYKSEYRDGIVFTVHSNSGGYGKLHESHFFKLRFYMKPDVRGTLHLTWKDEKLWQEFNKAAASKKNWLGDDYKWRRKETIKKGFMIEYRE